MVVGQCDTHRGLLAAVHGPHRCRARSIAPLLRGPLRNPHRRRGGLERVYSIPPNATPAPDGYLADCGGYLGANRCPASSRRHWPLSIGLSTMAATSFAYSMGRPI